jgi:putative endonuclease
MPRWSVYMVRCRDGVIYTGITTDLERRLAQHVGRRAGGAKFLRGRGPLCVLLQRPVGSRGLALAVEARLKRLGRPDKLALVARRSMLEPIISAARNRRPRRRGGPAGRAARRRPRAVNASGASTSISSRRGSSRR